MQKNADIVFLVGMVVVHVLERAYSNWGYLMDCFCKLLLFGWIAFWVGCLPLVLVQHQAACGALSGNTIGYAGHSPASRGTNVAPTNLHSCDSKSYCSSSALLALKRRLPIRWSTHEALRALEDAQGIPKVISLGACSAPFNKRMQLFCPQLEASCLQLSYFACSCVWELFAYNLSFFTYSSTFLLTIEFLCLQWQRVSKKHVNRL